MKGEKDFLDIVDRHQGILHKICKTYTYGYDLYEDLFQEIIINLWNSFESFEGRSKISTWMYQVALYTAINFRKYHNRRKFIPPEQDVAMTATDMHDHQDWLYAALDHLKAEEKALMILHLEGYNYREIAEIIGITETNTGARLSRIRKKLAKIMERI